MMKNVMVVLLLTFICFSACGQAPQIAESKSISGYDVQPFVTGVEIPWGMAWIDASTMLVTDRKGELRIIKDGKLVAEKVTGVPQVRDQGQGGLLDIVVDPNFDNNKLVYFSYSSIEGEGSGANTSVMRAKLDGFALTEQQVIFAATPNTTKGQHYGSRLVFDNQGYLYVSVGDRGERDVNPQRLDRDAGKIHRIMSDGSIPEDNPFVTQNTANGSVFSYGHRNPQGMAIHPITGDVWTHEHGPRGGDEVNIIQKGNNYGWPVISFGVNYSGTSFTDLTEKDGMEQPVWHWTPSIAPSGMAFITSDKYPEWQGKLIVGSLKFAYLVALALNGNEVVSQEVLFPGIGRVRNVKQGPDGYLYIATEGSGIVKIVPKKSLSF
jgi:glucose/arabinose dehydrogenase